MRIEKGKTYRAANGEKIGPVEHWWGSTDRVRHLRGDGKYWFLDGTGGGEARGNDLVAEWSEDPIVTETVQRIKPGVYGPLEVGAEISIPDCDRPDQPPPREIEAHLTTHYLDASDWRELARAALEIAEYLEHVD